LKPFSPQLIEQVAFDQGSTMPTTHLLTTVWPAVGMRLAGLAGA
jgi:hypothetical protein